MIIDQLNPTVTDNLADEVPVEQGQLTFKTTWQKILALFKSNIGLSASEISATGGTDVQSKLNSLDTSVSGKVSKSGDTMTGNLSIQANNTVSYLLKHLGMDVTSSSMTAAYASYGVNDANGNEVGILQAIQGSTGNVIFRMRASRNGVQNGFYLGVNNQGNPTMSIDNVALWQTTLGLAYEKNDTETISNVVANGYVTSGTANIYVSIPVSKSMANITNVAVTAMTGAIRGGSGAVDGTGNSTNIKSTYTVTAEKAGDMCVRVHILKTSGGSATAFTNVTNNTPVSFGGSITLKFT